MRNDQGTQDTAKGICIEEQQLLHAMPGCTPTEVLVLCSGGLHQASAAGRKGQPSASCGPCAWCKGACPVLLCGGRAADSGTRCLGLIPLCWATETYMMWHAQGLNIMAFCKEYNAATQDKVGTVIPVEITCFEV